MQVTLKVKRYDPELPENQRDYYQEYDLDISENSTVLDCLIDIREYQDEITRLKEILKNQSGVRFFSFSNPQINSSEL